MPSSVRKNAARGWNKGICEILARRRFRVTKAAARASSLSPLPIHTAKGGDFGGITVGTPAADDEAAVPMAGGAEGGEELLGDEGDDGAGADGRPVE